MELTRYASPLGTIFLAADNGALAGLWLEGQKYFAATLDEAAVERDDLPVFRQAAAWLDAYFAKQPLSDLPPLAPRGSDFRQAVWRLLLEIPYGQVTTYGALAQILRDRGISAAAQAVGGAVGHNPISILILSPGSRSGRQSHRLRRRRGEKALSAGIGGRGYDKSLHAQAGHGPVTVPAFFIFADKCPRREYSRRGHFYLPLQDNADQPAAALVDDAGQGFLQLFPGILRHPLQLGLKVVADHLVEAAAEDVGLPDLTGVPLEFL